MPKFSIEDSKLKEKVKKIKLIGFSGRDDFNEKMSESGASATFKKGINYNFFGDKETIEKLINQGL